MSPEVAAQIADLLNAQNQLSVPYTAASVLQHHDRYIVRLDEKSKVMGAVEVKKVQWYQCEIDHLSVLPEAMRRGIGTLLLKEAESRATQQGAKIAQCTIRSGNEASEHLFRQQGYRAGVTFLNDQTGNLITIYQKALNHVPTGQEVNGHDLYRVAFETRNLEISLFWQRSNYFLVLNTAIAAGFFVLKERSYAPFLCGMGLFVSFLWALINAGSKFWQSRWEARLARLESEITVPVRLFSEDKATVWSDAVNGIDASRHGPFGRLFDWLSLKKPSVSLMMFVLALGFVLFWAALLFWF